MKNLNTKRDQELLESIISKYGKSDVLTYINSLNEKLYDRLEDVPGCDDPDSPSCVVFNHEKNKWSSDYEDVKAASGLSPDERSKMEQEQYWSDEMIKKCKELVLHLRYNNKSIQDNKAGKEFGEWFRDHIFKPAMQGDKHAALIFKNLYNMMFDIKHNTEWI